MWPAACAETGRVESAEQSQNRLGATEPEKTRCDECFFTKGVFSTACMHVACYAGLTSGRHSVGVLWWFVAVFQSLRMVSNALVLRNKMQA